MTGKERRRAGEKEKEDKGKDEEIRRIKTFYRSHWTTKNGRKQLFSQGYILLGEQEGRLLMTEIVDILSSH